MPATKDEIALTFMGLAMRYGFRRTAVEDVARALRISKKTIYEYFPSKEALSSTRWSWPRCSSGSGSSRS